MATPLLMPKATAVWLVDNTALSVRADRRLLHACIRSKCRASPMATSPAASWASTRSRTAS